MGVSDRIHVVPAEPVLNRDGQSVLAANFPVRNKHFIIVVLILARSSVNWAEFLRAYCVCYCWVNARCLGKRVMEKAARHQSSEVRISLRPRHLSFELRPPEWGRRPWIWKLPLARFTQGVFVNHKRLTIFDSIHTLTRKGKMHSVLSPSFMQKWGAGKRENVHGIISNRGGTNQPRARSKLVNWNVGWESSFPVYDLLLPWLSTLRAAWLV